MAFFTQTKNTRLYIAETKGDDQGWLAYVLPKAITNRPAGITLDEALEGTKSTKFMGSFIFSAVAPKYQTKEAADSFVSDITKAIGKISYGKQFFLWLKDASNIAYKNMDYMGFEKNGNGFKVYSGLTATLIDNLSLDIDNSCKLTFDKVSQSITIKADGKKISFSGFKSYNKISEVYLSFVGPQRGCFKFRQNIYRESLYNDLAWGFQYLMKQNDQSVVWDQFCQWYPLADGSTPDSNDLIEFQISIDLTDIYNEHLKNRTYFAFTGNTIAAKTGESEPTQLASYFNTNFGYRINLNPVAKSAKLVFAKSPIINDKNQTFLLCPVGDFVMSRDNNAESPEGDFVMSIDNAEAGKTYELLCGLSGTETITFKKGDKMRFFPGKPAYAPIFPFPETSPVGPPIDLDKPLLDKTFKTSWLTIIGDANLIGDTNHYNAQPEGMSLYGKDDSINQTDANLLGFMETGFKLPQQADFCFPMVPYGGVKPRPENVSAAFTQEQIREFESKLISPTRRHQIAKAQPSASARASFGSGESYNVTTPSGLIVTLDKGSGNWQSILLGQNQSRQQMKFVNPTTTLQQAFQTNQLFLVVANANYLGDLGSDGVGENAQFCNTMTIEDWHFEAAVGQTNQYNDYNNIMIIKGRKGALKELVKTPDVWTQKSEFAAPTDLTGNPPKLDKANISEMVAVSQWLQHYIEETESDKSEFFAHFKRMVQDENWTGILFLKMKIAELPSQLAGLLAGVNQADFYAHHFAIEISPIDSATVSIKGSSSMFGLINYVDPNYDPNSGDEPIAASGGGNYDFKVLTLNVLFENSAIKHFQSKAQLTLNELFGSRVTNMGDAGNMYHSIILRGTFQENGDTPVYSMDTVKDYTFLFDNNVLNKIEIESAQMSTRKATNTETDIWFGMSGYIDFKRLHKASQTDDAKKMTVDLFSFGSEDGKALRSGLHFSNLGLAMDYPTPTPEKKTFTFLADKIRFDVSSSTIRKDSLYRSFALELEGLNSGNEEDTPSQQGFLDIITDLPLSGVDSGPWNGLKFRLNLGTPGDLAGKVGLNADLLLAWSSEGGKDSDYKVEAGLHLPGVTGGANLISLQNVLKLSFGPIRLLYAKEAEGSTERRFMLLLTSIALKFLGLMKIPPNGATMFYLFGNPESDGKASGLGWYAMYKQASLSERKISKGDK